MEQLSGASTMEVSVAQPIEISCELEATPDAPRCARQFVVARLSGLIADDRLDDIAVITSELATNAVHHAGSRFRVVATVDVDGAARVAVTDSARRPPRMRAAPPTAPDGRGLAIVAALAEQWGVEPRRSGKMVWAVVRPHRPKLGRPA